MSSKNGLFLIIALIINCFVVVQAEEIPADFDHDDTNFLLSGAHIEVECGVCHVRDVYQGIPVTCEECHTTSSLIAKSKKPASHFESEDACDNCHTVETWSGARIDHESVVGTCIDCHNNINSTGRPSDHVQSVDECQECHTTRRWKQSGFDHAVISGNCFSCHNGSTATGKPEKHRLSNNQCADCHIVQNWKSKSFDHKDIGSNCLSCHQDILPGKPHPQNNKCVSCHSPNKKWQQVRFAHEKNTEFCVTCHKGIKPSNHFIIESEATLRCDECHRSVASWISNVRFEHEVADFHEHRPATQCTACHLSNSRNVLFRLAQFKPVCAACHAANYRASSHPKYPGVGYRLEELAHCTIACHSYTNSSLTVRDNRRNTNAHYHSTTRGKGITPP